MPLRRNNDVLRFQIAMHDPALVGRSQGLSHLLGQLQRTPHGQAAFSQQVPERAALDQLQHHVLGALLFSDVEDRHDVRMIQRRDRLRLGAQSRPGLGVGSASRR